MAEIAFCETCGAKHMVESTEGCMCGGTLHRVSNMSDTKEQQYRTEHADN